MNDEDWVSGGSPKTRSAATQAGVFGQGVTLMALHSMLEHGCICILGVHPFDVASYP